jgi:hypothetical protein
MAHEPMIRQIEGFPPTRRMRALGVTGHVINPVTMEATIEYVDHLTGELVSEKVPLPVAWWFATRDE